MKSAVVLSQPTPPSRVGDQSKPLTWEHPMSADSVGEIIATRQLYYLDDSNEKRSVCVLIGKPHPSTGFSEYECSFQIIGLGNQQATKARGHDSIQALQSALILAAANLNHLNDQLGRKLVWEGGVKGELGFP